MPTFESARRPPDEAKVDVPGEQQALIALQDKRLIWSAAREGYAVEDKTIVGLLRSSGLLDGLS